MVSSSSTCLLTLVKTSLEAVPSPITLKTLGLNCHGFVQRSCPDEEQ